jgi:hypothetical protein
LCPARTIAYAPQTVLNTGECVGTCGMLATLRAGLCVSPRLGTSVAPRGEGIHSRGFLFVAAARIRITLAEDEHAEAMADFYRAVWTKDATADSVRASRRRAAAENVVVPGEAPPVVLAFEGNRVVGHWASIPQRLWDGVAERPSYWMNGLMVFPEFRNGLTALLLVKELAGRLSRSTTLTVLPVARGLLSTVGYTELGVVPNFVRPLRGASLARRLDLAEVGLTLPGWVRAGVRVAQRTGLAGLVGGAVGVAASLAAATARRAGTRVAAELAPEAPSREELDDLWRRARSSIAASLVRDGLYLRSRFGADERYAFVSVRDAGRLAGVAVVLRPREMSDPRLRGLRVATISDILFPPEDNDVGLALLGGVEQTARAAGSDAILCTTSNHGLMRVLKRQAFVRLPGNLHFFLRDTTDAGHWSSDLPSWWLARGDGGADAVF